MPKRNLRAAVAATMLFLLLGACGARKSETVPSPRAKGTPPVAASEAGGSGPAGREGGSKSDKRDPVEERKWAAYEKELDAWKERCVESPPRSQEEKARCQQTQPKSPDQQAPYAKSEFIEIVSLADLEKWWPHRPLYRSPATSSEGAAEVFAAASNEGGRKGDAFRDTSFAIVLYTYAPTTVDNASRGDLLKNRAIILGSRFFGPGKTPPVTPRGPGDKSVVVRGYPGWTFVATLAGHGGFKIRIFEWDEPNRRDGTIRRQATTGAEAYSERQVLEFLNGMEEIL